MGNNKKVNPIILVDNVEEYIKSLKRFEYVDNWVPLPNEVIFTNTTGTLFAPVSKYYKYTESNSLDYFIVNTKKCYTSDLMRNHMCKYLNYLEAFYDTEKEYFSILCQIKYMIDNGITLQNGTSIPYDINTFFRDIKRYILSNKMVSLVYQMAKDNYTLTISFRNNNNPSLQYTDEHGRVFMAISILMNMMIPLLTHYAYINKMSNGIDQFLLEAFDMVFDVYHHVDIYNKIYNTCNSNISKNQQSNKIIWDKQNIRGINVNTHTLSSAENTILNIIPKYVFDQNIISMNYSSIINNTGFQITDISFEYSFIPVSSSKRDEDNQSDMDKFESNLIKQDESKYIEVVVNAKKTMNRIENLYGKFREEEINHYRKIYGSDDYRDGFQRQLIFLTFYKYFGDTISINQLNQIDYIKLMIAAKKIYINHNMIIFPYIISGKVNKITGRRNVNKKELLKIENNPLYNQVIDKYKNSKIINIILGYISTIISSEFIIIDYDNAEIDGKKIDIIPEIVIDEVLLFVLLI